MKCAKMKHSWCEKSAVASPWDLKSVNISLNIVVGIAHHIRVIWKKFYSKVRLFEEKKNHCILKLFTKLKLLGNGGAEQKWIFILTSIFTLEILMNVSNTLGAPAHLPKGEKRRRRFEDAHQPHRTSIEFQFQFHFVINDMFYQFDII